MNMYEGFLPKNVQKILTKMANLQRKELALLQSAGDRENLPEETTRKMEEIYVKGSKAIEELLDTRYAVTEIGIGWDEDTSLAEMLHICSAYFLGLYAMERMSMEVLGEKGNEDVFYAGALLMHRSLMMQETEDDGDLYEEDDAEDDFDALLNRLDGWEPEEEDPQKIVPLFSDKKKGKK